MEKARYISYSSPCTYSFWGRLTGILAFCLGLWGNVTLSAQTTEILKAGQYPGRYSDVKAGQLYIRIAANYSATPLTVEQVGALLKVEVLEHLLPPERTLLYNPRFEFKRKKISLRGEIAERIYRAEDNLVRTFRVRYREDLPPEHRAFMMQKEFPFVEVAEPVYLHELLSSPPNDPRIPEQVQLPPMQALEAWEMYQGDSTIIIGISDSGTDQEHEDLHASIWTNTGEIPDNGIDDDGNGYVDDYRGYNFAWELDSVSPGNTSKVADTPVGNHGTGAAGLAAATPNNGIGIIGSGFKSSFFPLKTMEFGGNGIRFGAQSIIYAGEMEFDVINCSWGSQNFSEIVRSATEYAISRGVLITAGAGNNNQPLIFFPAAYKGVLGVGNTDATGRLARSNYGFSAQILAPSEFAITTSSLNRYGGYCCTSGASALMSGISGLARGKFPELSVEQTIAYLKRCTDDVRQFNISVADYLPGRINMLKVVTGDPFAAPGFTLDSMEILASDGQTLRRRVFVGDTLRVAFRLRNVLGTGNDIRWSLRALDDESFGTVEFLEDSLFTSTVASGDSVRLASFALVVRRFSDAPLFFRLDAASADGEYSEFFIAPFTPTEQFITVDNGFMRFSISDRGQIGFDGVPGMRRGGIGFRVGNSRNFLYEGGTIITGIDSGSGQRFIASATRTEAPGMSPSIDFTAVRRFDTDTLANSFTAVPLEMRGLTVHKLIDPLLEEVSVITIPISIERDRSTAAPPPQRLSAGYYLDWDVAFDNVDRGFIIEPDYFKESGAASVFALVRPDDPEPEGAYTISGAFSFTERAVPQMCIISNNELSPGTPFGTYDGFTEEEKILALESGTALLYQWGGDIALITGMMFEEPFADGRTTVEYVLTLGAAPTRPAVEEALFEALRRYGATSVEEDERKTTALWRLYPLPAGGTHSLTIEAPAHIAGEFSYRLFSAQGAAVGRGSLFFGSDARATLALPANLPQGVYFVSIERNGVATVLSFVL